MVLFLRGEVWGEQASWGRPAQGVVSLRELSRSEAYGREQVQWRSSCGGGEGGMPYPIDAQGEAYQQLPLKEAGNIRGYGDVRCRQAVP